MAKALRQLLGSNEPLFNSAVAKLEQATGRAGIDVRLIADTMRISHSIMRQLGLDITDTTPQELYAVLNARSDDVELIGLDSAFSGIAIDGQVISFNKDDITLNQRLPFSERTCEMMRCHLQYEIVARYNGHPRTDERVVAEFAHDAGIDACDHRLYAKMREQYLNDPKETTVKKETNSMAAVPKVLAIGDIISDDFIDMSMDHITVSKDDEGYEYAAMELGSKLPYAGVERVDAVECSPNAAVSLSRLGLDVSLMSWIGDDTVGHDMVTYLNKENVNTDNMVVEAGMKSNFHYVLRYGADRTKLQRFEDYSYEWKDPEVTPDWIYLGVLGEKTWPLHEAILDYMDRHPDIKLVFQPGMYHLEWGPEKLAEFYKRSEIVVMNREEAAQVTGRSREDVNALLEGLHELGVTDAVVTDGPAGAYASEGEGTLFMPIYPDIKKPYDRTGAGDAFASTLTAALVLGESLETALTWAPINSMNVSQFLGAQKGLLTRPQLQEFLDNAPADYQISAFDDDTSS